MAAGYGWKALDMMKPSSWAVHFIFNYLSNPYHLRNPNALSVAAKKDLTNKLSGLLHTSSRVLIPKL
jgi:hypothetical protein